jgi:DegV family protein with EDD domain
VTVRIVTDSTADLSPEMVKELGITVVPEYVLFGDKTYRDGIDISYDQLYEKLINNPKPPSTSQPTPADFTRVYQELAKETNDIISIHLAGKLSGTYSSALQGKKIIDSKCNISIIDSESVTMGLGMLVISAARLALNNEKPEKIINEIKEEMKNIHLFATFDTLKYLALGGRIGKARALFGSILNVKPVITLRDGEFLPVGNFRTRAKALDKLCELANNTVNINELAVVYSTTPDEAQSLKTRMGPLVESNHFYIARLGPALGVHGGPGTLAVVIRSKTNENDSEKDASNLSAKKISGPSIHLPKLKLPSRR